MVGQGQRVATSTLRYLWKNQDQFDSLVTELKPKNNEPRDGVRCRQCKAKGLGGAGGGEEAGAPYEAE